ncbi:MAG: endolytic transglycosylase MltG [Lachnospiraceae bacterium]|nr:endolytic transglycosylase MltG [Lachnospiraceae bacterium]
MAKKKAKEVAGRVVLGMTKGALHVLVTVLFYILVIIALFQLGKLTYKYAYQITGAVTVDEAPGKEEVITVETGEGTMDLADELYEKGLILNKYTFYIRAKLNRKTPILPGTYTISSAMTYDDILTILAGKTLDT